MGQAASYSASSDPVAGSEPTGVIVDYAFPHERTLVLMEQPFTFGAEEYAIRDTRGELVFKCRRKEWEEMGKKVLLDADGEALLSIWPSTTQRSSSSGYTIYTPDSTARTTTVESRIPQITAASVKTRNKKALKVGFYNRNDRRHPKALVLHGNFVDMEATVTLNSVAVARLTRHNQLNPGAILPFGRRTYFLTVSPNIDCALLAAICICYDEKTHGKHMRTRAKQASYSLV